VRKKGLALHPPLLCRTENERRFFCEVPGVCAHAVENELMEPIARPGIADPKRFENNERLAQRICE
jgi:hypothetical protein